jgi:hypothetical protein
MPVGDRDSLPHFLPHLSTSLRARFPVDALQLGGAQVLMVPNPLFFAQNSGRQSTDFCALTPPCWIGKIQNVLTGSQVDPFQRPHVIKGWGLLWSDWPGSLGTQEKAPALYGCTGSMQTLLNVYTELGPGGYVPDDMPLEASPR